MLDIRAYSLHSHAHASVAPADVRGQLICIPPSIANGHTSVPSASIVLSSAVACSLNPGADFLNIRTSSRIYTELQDLMAAVHVCVTIQTIKWQAPLPAMRRPCCQL